MQDETAMHGGKVAAEVLVQHGVRFLFTLCGGHISPLLVGAKQAGVRVVDVRHEATAVFAADAVARLSGVPGVAAVTAGPGLTNTITALKNAQLAQSPLVLLGGATATLLKGRGALQDIDQMALMRPHVKWAVSVRRVRDIAPTLERAFQTAQSDVPGPVFVELPVDLLYPQAIVHEWHVASAGRGRSLAALGLRLYVGQHVRRTFAGAWRRRAGAPLPVSIPQPTANQLEKAAALLGQAQRPVCLIGSQALRHPDQAQALQQALIRLGAPVYLSGMARGLLGRHPLHLRHQRSQALREADVVVLAGVPCDFRLNYGQSIPRSATLIAINRSRDDLFLNRRPTLAVQADAGAFLQGLTANWPAQPERWAAWRERLSRRDAERDAEIAQQAAAPTAYLNPLQLCRDLEKVIDDNSVIIGDGGDFVATASYIVRPRAPLSWLDPGVFGTLGPGAGFALGAKLVRPEAEVWIVYGDGSAGYSLAEFDTFTRHELPVIAVVGSDGVWAQIAREQTTLLGDGVATEIGRPAYHGVAQAWGGAGLLLDDPADSLTCLLKAKELARAGRPVLLNAYIGATDFRKGSISI